MFKKFSQPELEDNFSATFVPEKPGLYCSICLAYITSADEKIEMSGSHLHTCTNPAGQIFTIGCFYKTPGCGYAGAPTHEHTWFPGYRWCIALCGHCQQHLGWRFSGTADHFHGLIVNTLLEK